MAPDSFTNATFGNPSTSFARQSDDYQRVQGYQTEAEGPDNVASEVESSCSVDQPRSDKAELVGRGKTKLPTSANFGNDPGSPAEKRVHNHSEVDDTLFGKTTVPPSDDRGIDDRGMIIEGQSASVYTSVYSPGSSHYRVGKGKIALRDINTTNSGMQCKPLSLTDFGVRRIE